MVMAPIKRPAHQVRDEDDRRARHESLPPGPTPRPRADDSGPHGRSPRKDCTMPKMKTHRGAAKRFRLSGSGKVMRRKATS